MFCHCKMPKTKKCGVSDESYMVCEVVKSYKVANVIRTITKEHTKEIELKKVNAENLELIIGLTSEGENLKRRTLLDTL